MTKLKIFQPSQLLRHMYNLSNSFTISSWLAAPIPSVTKHQHLRFTQQLTRRNEEKWTRILSP